MIILMTLLLIALASVLFWQVNIKLSQPQEEYVPITVRVEEREIIERRRYYGG